MAKCSSPSPTPAPASRTKILATFSIPTGRRSAPRVSARASACRSRRASWSRTAGGFGGRANRETERSFSSRFPWRSRRRRRSARDDRRLHPHRGEIAVLHALPVELRARGDAFEVVPRFLILRDAAAEALDGAFAGVVRGQRELLVAETFHEVMQIASAGGDVRV